MTTCLWTGQYLLADSRSTMGNGFIEPAPFPKLYHLVTKVDPALADRPWNRRRMTIAFAGASEMCQAVIKWLAEGAEPEHLPKSDQGRNWEAIVVVKDGDAPRKVYTAYNCPLIEQHGITGIGTGGFYAVAAYLAAERASNRDPDHTVPPFRNALLAMSVAIQLDSHSGGGIHWADVDSEENSGAVIVDDSYHTPFYRTQQSGQDFE